MLRTFFSISFMSVSSSHGFTSRMIELSSSSSDPNRSTSSSSSPPAGAAAVGFPPATCGRA
uniref:Uncharacterized protein n=1 Tax=Anopheles christyi TaxID=43041 RepID=A0A182KIU3_9DIPT